jgi:hypothetical protein
MNYSYLFSKTNRNHFASVFLLSVGATVLPSHAQTSGSNGSHDPSRMIESEGRVYIYSTGGGGKSSADGLVWENEPTPPWNTSLLANNQRIWAPDGIFLNNQYYLYGAMWSDAKASVIILMTSPTLNPKSPNYKWTDQGIVIPGPAGVTHSVIDGAPILDNDGKFWIVWGGGYPFPNDANSIWLTPLDPKTGLALTTDAGYKPPNNPGYPLEQGHKEGPYIHYHSGYYYLWWQTGSCCSGTSSSYTMHVARSASIKGPYTGDRTFYASNSTLNIHGPGHMGIYSCGGVEVFTYHYYPSGGSVIGVNSLTWGSDGWPIAGTQVKTGLKLPCSTSEISNQPKVAIQDGLQVQKMAHGFNLFVPTTVTGVTAEVLDIQGKQIGVLNTRAGWNAIPGGMLVSGINVIRIASGEGFSIVRIVNNP